MTIDCGSWVKGADDESLPLITRYSTGRERRHLFLTDSSSVYHRVSKQEKRLPRLGTALIKAASTCLAWTE
jgi:hypothetical protein